jgi:hypothetical protein
MLYVFVDCRRGIQSCRQSITRTIRTNYHIYTLLPPDDGLPETCRCVVTQQIEDKQCIKLVSLHASISYLNTLSRPIPLKNTQGKIDTIHPAFSSRNHQVEFRVWEDFTLYKEDYYFGSYQYNVRIISVFLPLLKNSS